jgi:hypothetical protein
MKIYIGLFLRQGNLYQYWFPHLMGVPTEEEIEDAVGWLKTGRAAGPSSMRSEHLKEWLAAAVREADPDTQIWCVFVELIHHIFRSSQLPTELSWSLLVLIPKDSGGCRGIGLLEVVWKVVSSIIDIPLKGDPISRLTTRVQDSEGHSD